jgi:radical SAM superfamily enzyme YgiQ (UPF0313 family)
MILYHFDLRDVPYYLFSYLDTYSSLTFKSRCISVEEVPSIENSQKNYLVFSSIKLNDIYFVMTIVNMLRKIFGVVKINIVCGGAAHYMIENDDLVRFYPEITHVCLGKGEQFFKHLLEDRLPRGIYDATPFGKITPYVISRHHTPKDPVLLTFSDNRCNWNKCLFCHHTTKFLKPVIPPVDLVRQMEYYIEEMGVRQFILYDNNLNPVFLKEALESLYEKGYAKYNLEIYIFGLRVDTPFQVLEDILNKWKPSPIWGGAWGVEFYDQKILDLFKKNSTLDQIDAAINFFYRYGIVNNLYLLFGLPLVTNDNIKNLEAFIERSNPMINEYYANWFLLNDSLPIYKDREIFKIIPGDIFTFRDYYRDKPDIAPIRTKYQHYESWDDDEGRYVGRDETFKKYLPLYKHSRLNFKKQLYFLSSETAKTLDEYRLGYGLEPRP